MLIEPSNSADGRQPRRHLRLALLLRVWTQEVQVAYDRPSTLESAAEFRPEVILADLSFPGWMNSYEVAKRLRQVSSVGSALLIAFFGYGQEKDRRRTREAGFDDHLVKPVDPNALQALLANLNTPPDQ